MIVALLALLVAGPLCPHPHRSQASVRAFIKATPCPETCRTYVKQAGKFRLYQRCGACQVDHVCALACGGLDVPSNMEWLSSAANRKKSADCAKCNIGNQGACAVGPKKP